MKRVKLALAVALSLVLSQASVIHAGSADKRLDIYWCDTEGGAATLIVTPAGQSILIDTGNPGNRDPSRIAKVATEVAGLKKIDHLIITHYHVDHFGGAARLSELIPIGLVHENGEFPGGWERPSKEYLDFKCDGRSVIHPGDTLDLTQAGGSPAVQLKCLAARREVIAAPVPNDQRQARAMENLLAEGARRKREDYSDNANSIVSLLSFGDFRFFDGGDLTWNNETKLVAPVNLVGVVDVFQVEHHGLDLSNNPVLVKSLAPTVAIMNNGPTKGAATEVMQTLRSTDSIQAIYQMHRDLKPGEEANNQPDPFIANFDPTATCQGHYIKLSVDPQARTYTVTVPSTRHERSFNVKGPASQPTASGR